MSHNHFFPLEFLKLGHPHVQEIIMFFVQVARWYFVPTVPHWNWFDPLKSFEDNLQEAVPKRIQHTQTSNPVSTFDILPVSQISPHSGSPQWPAMDCHRPLDFCCAVRAPGAPATPAAAVPQRWQRRHAAVAALARGVELLRQGQRELFVVGSDPEKRREAQLRLAAMLEAKSSLTRSVVNVALSHE